MINLECFYICHLSTERKSGFNGRALVSNGNTQIISFSFILPHVEMNTNFRARVFIISAFKSQYTFFDFVRDFFMNRHII